MKILSVNISDLKLIEFKGREEQTGFFKTSTKVPVVLEKEGVKGDKVGDKVHHGGVDKACYLYSYDHYAYWQQLYPELDWDYGMFGENLTVSGLNESKIFIGDTFKLGTAVIQVSQPRQPCYKLGIKFNNQKMVNAFRKAPYPGVYARVLEEGTVSVDDRLELIKRAENSLSVLQVFQVIYAKEPKTELIRAALENPFLAANVKNYLNRKFNV